MAHFFKKFLDPSVFQRWHEHRLNEGVKFCSQLLLWCYQCKSESLGLHHNNRAEKDLICLSRWAPSTELCGGLSDLGISSLYKPVKLPGLLLLCIMPDLVRVGVATEVPQNNHVLSQNLWTRRSELQFWFIISLGRNHNTNFGKVINKLIICIALLDSSLH